MSWLFEDPTMLVVVGVLIEGLLAVALVKSGRLIVAAPMLAVLVLVVVGVIVEVIVVTPREEVEMALDSIAEALVAGEVEMVVSWIHPRAESLRSRARSILPHVKISEAHVGGDLDIRINRYTSPPTATANFTGRIKAAYPSQGIGASNYVRRFSLKFRPDAGRWLVSDYTERSFREGDGDPR